MSFYYFAYGSNMLTKRLQKRCPSAVKVACAYADNTIIEFSKLSRDCSGKATLRCQDGYRVPGVLFEIKISERKKLDRCEGAGNSGGYIRCDSFPVHLTENNDVFYAATYLATCPKLGLKPYDWYLALIIAGAKEHELDEHHRQTLQRVPYLPDPDLSRNERRKAIKVLSKSGFPDYRCLLGFH